jgi:LuxR family maltose regulon positive regulatory protein
MLPVGTPAWYAWLGTASSFAFTSEAGTFTARKERAGNQRGGWYWKAYHKQHGKLTTLYIGKSETLTLARLQEVAQALSAALVETTPEPEAEVAVPSAPAATRGMWSEAPPLLATKLYRPLPRAHLVRRPQLIARLTQGAEGPLTLVSAPAGFGKTTLLAQWLAERGTPAAWLSLDAGENDPTRFLAYLIAALQTIAPNLGAGVVGLLHSPQPPPIEALLTTLLNELTTIPDPFVLVLDDYHLLEAHPVDQALTYLVEHLPPQMHLVLATRQDPSLPLARFRARGQLRELRAADLRFTPAEAADFLTQVMDLPLSADDIAALEARTEGWIAGLQLAALSLQSQPDPTRFIQSFTGSHQFVLDYLVEEVLKQQPEPIQTFLLRTSLLERLCGPLCDAVVLDPATSGQATLEYLDRANLFLVPLDQERQWYRYHHLFAELLRQRLQQRLAASPGEAESQVNALHLRASHWYEAQGLQLEAFQHAAAANEVERALRLVGDDRIPVHRRGAMTVILHWLASLPRTVLDLRPWLLVRYASALLVVGQTTGVEEQLQAAETALRGAKPDHQTQDLIGQIATVRAGLAFYQNQIEPMLTQSRRALESLHPNNLPFRTMAHWTLGYAFQLQGDRAAAHRAYTEAIALGQACRDIFFCLPGTIGLGTLQEAENQLPLAAETYQRALHLAGEMPQPIMYEAHLGLARICYEWNDLEAAERHGRQSLHLARQFERGIDRFVACEVFLARLKLAQRDQLPEVAAAQVLTLLHQGNLAAAAQLAETHGLPLSQARVHLARRDPAAALTALERWRAQVEAKGWADELLKVLVLQALALQAASEQDQAVSLLLEALALAEPEGFIRIFVDEGRPMAQLLAEAVIRQRRPAYTSRLLAAFEAEKQRSTDANPLSSLPSSQPLIEPLTPREREVLQLMAQGLSNQEISERLVLALDTVKGHNQKIFGKLQVQRRTEAVARARELGLL